MAGEFQTSVANTVLSAPQFGCLDDQWNSHDSFVACMLFFSFALIKMRLPLLHAGSEELVN